MSKYASNQNDQVFLKYAKYNIFAVFTQTKYNDIALQNVCTLYACGVLFNYKLKL